MPILLTYKCAYCGTATEEMTMGSQPPSAWVNITVAGRPEWFDKWACVSAYAAERASAE